MLKGRRVLSGIRFLVVRHLTGHAERAGAGAGVEAGAGAGAERFQSGTISQNKKLAAAIASTTPPTVTQEEAAQWDSFEHGTFQNKKPATLEQVHAAAALARTAPPAEVDPLWSGLSDTEVRAGLGVLRPFAQDERLARFDSVLEQRTKGVRFVFENPANVNNCWAALRTFDACGIQYTDIVLDDAAYYNKERVGSMVSALGSQKWLSLAKHRGTSDCITALKDKGYRVAVADLHHPNTVPLDQVDFAAGLTAIILGNEKTGASTCARELADIHFYVPMKGFSESLNVSAFVAILCGQLEAQGALDASLPHGRIPQTEQDRIYLTWLARSVPGSIALLRRAGLNLLGNKIWENVAGYTTKP